MQPNMPYIPPTQEPPTYVPVVPAVPVKKNSILLKVLVALLIAVIIGAGIGAYLWRDMTATRQKNDDAAKITQLESEVANLNTKVDQLSGASGVGELFSATSMKSDTVKAQTNASTVLKIAEAHYANVGYYPRTTVDFSTIDFAKLPAGIVVSTAAPTASNGKTTIRWEYTGNATAPSGGRISYWDFTLNEVSVEVYYAGEANAGSTFVTPTS